MNPAASLRALRLIALLLAPLTSPAACSVTSSAVARRAPSPPGPLDLTGTVWLVTYEIAGEGRREHEAHFLPDGRLLWLHPNDTTRDNDAWFQRGADLQITVNSSYVVYSATVPTASQVADEAAVIEGEAVNRNNRRWTWRAQRLR